MASEKFEVWLHEGKDTQTAGFAFTQEKAQKIADKKLKKSKAADKWVEVIDSHDTQVYKAGPGAP